MKTHLSFLVAVRCGFLALMCHSPLSRAGEDDIPWSFHPLYRPALPAVTKDGWERDPMDRFILNKLESKGIAPTKDADRSILIRRVTFDLTGLPPTPGEIDAFLRDPAKDDQALASVVDNLLKSPRFGERWARHWLDVVRYSDSVGRTMNASFPFARRYRDYVIDAFNKDKPYNRFIAEQVAGDLLPFTSSDEQAESRIATGLLTMASLDLSEGGELFRLDQVDDQIDVTTRAFLGLTMSCARCHNHKTDPISQADYYSLAGIFYSTQTLQGQQPKGYLGPNGYVDVDNLVRVPVSGDSTGADGTEQRASAADTGDDASKMDMMNQGNGYPVYFPYDPTRAMGVAEGEVEDCAIAIKGDPFNRGETPPRGGFQLLNLPKLPPIPDQSSGRLELAKWLTMPTHPLTARVMVNRIWQHLFGRGLVRSVDDFGITGDAPTHPELLDHLAVRFVESGWSVKAMIRSILMSRSYRLSSAGDAAKENLDGSNDLFWRMNLRRLEMEAIRDSLFFVAGELSFERPRGTQVAGFGGKGRNTWLRSLTPEDASCRSVYLPSLRSMLTPMQETFDFPDPSQIKGQREITTVSPQALFFLNGDLAGRLSRSTATGILEGNSGDDAARIREAYLRVLGRHPDPPEIDEALQLMKELSSDDPASRWTVLIQALMSSAEFRYVL
ncbi:MAG: DUF1549 and DUF1553 domain-containing protein [Verrucomicrobiales bacterium]